MSSAKQTQARLIDQRARRRATQALIEAYRNEFAALLLAEKAAAQEEAAQMGEGVRLKRGRRLPGETALDRTHRHGMVLTAHVRPNWDLRDSVEEEDARQGIWG